MTNRHVIRLVPFPAMYDGRFDLPADHGPIVYVEFGTSPRDGKTSVPVMVWTAEIEMRYCDE